MKRIIIYTKVSMLALLMFFGSACLSSRVYMPTTHQGLFFDKAGDSMVSVNTSISYTPRSPDASTDIMAAVNITNQFGVGYYSTNNESVSNLSTQEQAYQEIFFVLNPIKQAGPSRQEIILGIGRGKGAAREDQGCIWECIAKDFTEADAEYNKYSIQYTNGAKKSWFEAGAAMKLSYLDVYNFNSEKFFNDRSEFDSNPKNGVFFEPAGFFRIGYKPIKIEFQFGITRALSRTDFGYDKSFFSFGLNIRPELFLDILKKD